jgi:hypothetical protein
MEDLVRLLVHRTRAVAEVVVYTAIVLEQKVQPEARELLLFLIKIPHKEVVAEL